MHRLQFVVKQNGFASNFLVWQRYEISFHMMLASNTKLWWLCFWRQKVSPRLMKCIPQTMCRRCLIRVLHLVAGIFRVNFRVNAFLCHVHVQFHCPNARKSAARVLLHLAAQHYFSLFPHRTVPPRCPCPFRLRRFAPSLSMVLGRGIFLA